ncbi:hypothetical protein FB45DRAFT_1008354 [Roridomyces roridus]|uniref:Glycan binding protein Y3-like domain-containing protein n=1 Tax=Roridomyces roridus TaxID=1738132 RepID=A0AAD7BA73_9AGAR|nr:hypothetical protein FB45DRAFT_1008354 [Roridomyces roridus]
MLYKPLIAAAIALAAVQTAVAQITTVCNPAGTEASCTQFIATFCNFASGVVVCIISRPRESPKLNALKQIDPADTLTRCFTLDAAANLKCDFTALNTHTTSTGISGTNCQNVLAQVNTTCPLGGFGQVTGAAFQFYGDPNTGACGPPAGN